MYFRIPLVLFLLSALAGFASSVPNCDNKCRMRNVFRNCDPPDENHACLDTAPATCQYCSLNANYKCYPKGGDSPNNTCKTNGTKMVILDYWTDCTDVCECTGAVLYAEAKEPRNYSGGTTAQQYTCQ